MKKLSLRFVGLKMALVMGACGSSDPGAVSGQAQEEASASNATCSIDSLRELPDVRLVSVTEEAEPVPHCKVAGVIGTETNFELLLPDDWNGKFVMGGGGGFVGSVVNRAQDFWGALQMGYATVGTDTGHQAHSLTADWALNNLERLVSFGHVAVHRTAVTAKALTKGYYDQDIARSYFAGCSRGGGQALMEAQRYPEDFEGIVAAAPAYNWTHEMGARWLRNAQLMYPDPTRIDEPVIDSEALKLIGDAVMAQCDDLDGLSDGVLNDPRQCDFDVASLACGDTKSKPEYFASFSTTIRTGVMPATTLRTSPRRRLASRLP